MTNILSFISGHKKLFIIVLIALILIGYFIWLIYENSILNITTYDVSSKDLPKEFEGFKIAQISDFHNTQLGEDNDVIIDKLKEEKPDIIVITGDYIDCRNPDLDCAERLTKRLVGIAPTYYCTGNHESRLPSELKLLEESFEKTESRFFAIKNSLSKRAAAVYVSAVLTIQIFSGSICRRRM